MRQEWQQPLNYCIHRGLASSGYVLPCKYYIHGNFNVKLLSNDSPMDFELLQQKIARRLLSLELRPPIVAQVTGLNQRYLRAVWAKVHKSSPPRGLTRKSSGWLIRICDLKDASVFLAILNVITRENPSSETHILHLLEAYDTYTSLFDNCTLNFPACYMLARDYIHGNVHIEPCPECDIPYIKSIHSKRLFDCPHCK